MSTKELIKTYTYDDIHTDRRGERTKVVKGRTVIELGTKAATSFVGNLYRVYDYSVKSYKQLLLVGVAKQPLDGEYTDFEESMYEEAMDIRIEGVTANNLYSFFKKQPEVRYTYKINDTNVHFDIPKGKR